MFRQPLLGGGAMRREVDELGVVSGPIEDPHGPDRWTLDDGEVQGGAHRERPVDTDRNDTAGAIVGLVQGETPIRVERAGIPGALFADQSPLAVVGLPGVELPAVALRRSRSRVGPGDDGAERRVFENHTCGHAVLHLVKLKTKPPPGEPDGGRAVERRSQPKRYSAASR